MRHSKMWNQIQEREKENPDDIDEVPVQAHHFDGTVILRTEMSAPCAPDHPEQEADADDHVQRMQSGQAPVENHEELNLRRELRNLMPCEAHAREESLSPVRVVLVSFHAEED